MADGDRQFVTVNRGLPTAYADNLNRAMRAGRYGEAMVLPATEWRNVACDEGTYFVATNPTPGTGIAGIAATGAFTDLESTLFISNGASTSESTRIYLDQLELIVTAAGTSGTDKRYVSKLDTGTSRYTSGGSSITPVNPCMASSNTSAATIKFGALVTTAASASVRLAAAGLIRTVITVVGDRYIFDFGGTASAAGMPLEGTLQAQIVIAHTPVVLGPGDQFVMSIHGTAEAAASSYEFNLSYVER